MRYALPSRLGLIALAAGLCLGGCGRRGPLEAPPGTSASQLQNAATGEQKRIAEDPDQPGLIQSPNQVYDQPAAVKQQVLAQTPPKPPINRAATAPRRDTFVLDPLL